MKYEIITGQDPENLAEKVNEKLTDNPGSILLGGPAFSVHYEPAQRTNVIYYAQGILLRDRETANE